MMKNILKSIFTSSSVHTMSVCIFSKTERVTQLFCSKPNHSDPVFQGCSLTKTLTAYAVVKAGLDLDVPVNTLLPRLYVHPSVTLRHCLSMTANIGYGEVGSGYPPYFQEDPVPSASDMVFGEGDAKGPAIISYGAPGEFYHYTGAGFMLAQAIIEKTVNMSFQDLVQKIIFTPFQMINSTLQCPLGSEFQTKAAKGHDKDGKILPNGWYNITSAGSGGLWTTAEDMAKFLQAIMKDPVAEKLFETQEAAEVFESCFGLGVVIDSTGVTKCIKKTGFNEGYFAQYLFFPETEQGVVVMTNSALKDKLIQACIQALVDAGQLPKIKVDLREIVSRP